MADPVITVENISKRYRLGVARHDTLRDRLMHVLKQPFRRGASRGDAEEFWALRDVSFDVRQGEVLGIIGRNGAGKSTLLKVLSRITEPTTGRIAIRGRVASLLEVGTGFHPELTGRENVFLNGAILGMSRGEIRRKFDEIVAFAEVERFLDTPVKHYSSGMYVRLAFAVAAHLEPEILIVDEVLAVGDAAFQQKCLGKIESLTADGGRTVLMVSHNMASVQQLCPRVIRMHAGAVAGDGDALTEIQHYFGGATAQDVVRSDLSKPARALEPRGGARLLSVELVSRGPAGFWRQPFGTPLQLLFTVEVTQPCTLFEMGLGLFNLHGQEIVSSLSTWERELGPVQPGHYELRVDYGALDLALGAYRFGVGLKSERGLEDYIPEAFELEVVPSQTTRANLTSIRGAIAHKATYSLRRTSP